MLCMDRMYISDVRCRDRHAIRCLLYLDSIKSNSVRRCLFHIMSYSETLTFLGPTEFHSSITIFGQ